MTAVVAASEMTTASQIELERAMDEIVAAATGNVTPPTGSGLQQSGAPSRRRQGTFCGEVECDSDVEMTTAALPAQLSGSATAIVSAAESAEQMRVSLDSIRRHLFAGDRQIGVPLSPTGDDSLVERIRSYMSDGGTPLPASGFVSEAEETDHDEDKQSDADDEQERVEHVEEDEAVKSSDVQKTNNDHIMVSVPLWLFLTTMISFVAYLTFVIYLLSWECRMPVRIRH